VSNDNDPEMSIIESIRQQQKQQQREERARKKWTLESQRGWVRSQHSDPAGGPSNTIHGKASSTSNRHPPRQDYSPVQSLPKAATRTIPEGFVPIKTCKEDKKKETDTLMIDTSNTVSVISASKPSDEMKKGPSQIEPSSSTSISTSLAVPEKQDIPLAKTRNKVHHDQVDKSVPVPPLGDDATRDGLDSDDERMPTPALTLGPQFAPKKSAATTPRYRPRTIQLPLVKPTVPKTVDAKLESFAVKPTTTTTTTTIVIETTKKSPNEEVNWKSDRVYHPNLKKRKFQLMTRVAQSVRKTHFQASNFLKIRFAAIFDTIQKNKKKTNICQTSWTCLFLRM
jgi:hypothetical protein